MELDDEQKEAEEALRTAQLQDTRAWLRQVEEENEVKLRERLNEQRKVQQEHFRKLVSSVRTIFCGVRSAPLEARTPEPNAAFLRLFAGHSGGVPSPRPGV